MRFFYPGVFRMKEHVLLNQERAGRCWVSPDTAAAGQMGTWTFTYETGSYGIEDSGAIRLAWRMVSDWEVPQFDSPEKSGYTTVTTDGNAQLSLCYSRYQRPYTNSLLVTVVRGSLKPGDRVIITMGDTSGGGPGIRAQSFQEAGHLFRLLVDVTGSGIFRDVAATGLPVAVRAGVPHCLNAVLPGSVEAGKTFWLQVCCLDDMGNPCPDWHGEVDLKIIGADPEICTYPRKISFADAAGGVVRVEACLALHVGYFQIEVGCEAEGWSCRSNPCLVEEHPGLRLYWGDMHGQNANTLGTGTLDEYYLFARNVAGIDFAGWQGNDFEITDEDWAAVREKTAAYLEEDRFVPFLGYEWSGSTPVGGDYNIFFRGDSPCFYPSSNWVSAPNADPDLITTPVSELWKRFENRDDVMAIPHVGGRCGNLAFLDERYSPAVEVHSHHGTFDWFALEAMRRRLKVGFVASSDDHTCRLGLFYPGRGTTPSGGFDVASGYCGIWAESLSRESLWRALRARHCFASTIDRLCLRTSLDTGAFMGDSCVLDGEASFRVEAIGRYPIDQILIYDWDRVVADIRPRLADERCVRIRWRGVIPGGKHKSTTWDGTLSVENGRIRSAENYAIDRADQGIQMHTSSSVSWLSTTSGDYDGLLLHLSGEGDPVIHFHSAQGNCSVRRSELMNGTVKFTFAPHCSVEFDLTSALQDGESCRCTASWRISPDGEEHAWWVKVLQTNGNAAWASPIFTSGT